jgi:nucleoside-diphosphate-sugar epimerase
VTSGPDAVVVTGCGGYLGSLLCLRLLEDGRHVVGIDQLRYGGEALAGFISHPRFRFIKTDVRSLQEDMIPAARALVHLAALVGPVCEQDRRTAMEINCDASVRLARWTTAKTMKFVFASTCSNYGVCDGLAHEDVALKPFGTYAESKVKAEREILTLRGAKVLRLGTLAGISPRTRSDLLINQWVWDAVSSGRIDCFAPSAKRPFLHVRDAADAIATLIDRWDDARSDCYNAAGFNVSKGELAAEISRVTGCTVEIRGDDEDRRDYAVTSALIQKELGIQPRVGMTACVDEVYRTVKYSIFQPRGCHRNA